MPEANLEDRVTVLEENMKQFADVPAKIDALDARVAVVESQIVQLRDEMHGEFSSIRTEMRVLHEAVISRIALLGEAPGRHPRTGTRRARRKKR